MKPNPENDIECYLDADFTGGWDQEEVKDTGLVLSRTGYLISYTNCPIIWLIQIQMEILLSTTEEKYIALYQAMRYVLHYVSLMKEFEFVLKLQGDFMTVLCSIVRNSLRRQSRSDRTCGFPENATLYKAHLYQVPALP